MAANPRNGWDLAEGADAGNAALTPAAAAAAFVPIDISARIPVAGATWVGAGDSITNGASSTNAVQTSWRAMTAKIAGGLVCPEIVVNGGVPGETSAQVLARIPALLPLGDAIIFAAGTNDTDPSTILSSIQSAWELCQAAKKSMIVCTVPPRGSGEGAEIAARIATQNIFIKTWARSVGAGVADTFFALVDPATGYLAAGYDSGDGVHPNNAGHLAMAEVIAAAMTSASSAMRAWPMGMGGGLMTDTLQQVPTGNYGYLIGPFVTPVRSIVASSDGDLPAGSWRRITVDNSGGGAATYAICGSHITTGFSAGDKLLVGGYFRCAVGGAAVKTALGKVQILDQTLTAKAVLLDYLPSANPGPLLRKWTVPTSGTPTSIYLAVEVRAAAGEVATVDIGAADIINLTTSGLTDLY